MIKKTYIIFIIFISFLPFLLNAQSTVFTNSGSMNVAGNGIMYVNGGTIQEDKALIDLEGKIVILGDFENNVVTGNVFTDNSSGNVEFIGNELQTVKGTADKHVNYIDFPEIIVSKDDSYVVMDAGMGANIAKLDLKKGKLVLDADGNFGNDDITSYNSHIKARMMNVIFGNITYNRNVSDIKLKGVVEVQRPLPGNYEGNRIFGFASPYKSLYGDYFFANWLSSPDGNGLWGEDDTSIKNPKTLLSHGLGYFSGQNILPQTRYELDPIWGNAVSLYDARFKDGIVFNRYKHEDENNPIINTITDIVDRYTEELNIYDITLSLKKGWQYIGNPFTSNLDLEKLLNQSDKSDSWEVVRTDNNSGGLSTRYFVNAGGEGVLDNWTPDRFYINPVWLVGQKEGSTIQRENNDRNLIAPMQMIAVYANEDLTVTIPINERTHRISGVSYPVTDELLIETGHGEFFDRTVVVFRDGASVNATDKYDVSKVVDSLASPGQIFTVSGDGLAMISNVLPSNTENIELGLIPALSPQKMELSAHRIASLNSSLFTQIMLEDRVEGGPMFDLKSGGAYTFTSVPDDRIDRFVVHINNNQPSVPGQIPQTLFAGNGIPATNKIAISGTGPVGSKHSDIKIDLSSGVICKGEDSRIEVDLSTVNVRYNAYDQVSSGTLKGFVDGTGSKVTINASAINSSTYYVNAVSTDGLITIVRRRPVDMNFIKSMIYPDIRVLTCPVDQTIKLSKYIDPVNFKSVTWEKSALIGGTLSGDTYQMSANDFGTNIFKYTVTDACGEASPAYLYLSTNVRAYTLNDTVRVCYDNAEAIQLNQIFGLEAGGEIKPENPSINSEYFTVSGSSDLSGAAIFNGKAAYSAPGLIPEDAEGDKNVVFIYTPPVNSCFERNEYKLVLKLTSEI